jgi:hypothetical protein
MHAMYELLWFISVCFPLMYSEPQMFSHYGGKDHNPSPYHWLTTARCAQSALPIKTARDHYGTSFECVLSSQDACEREADDLDEMQRCVREAAQYGKECVE